MKVALVNQPWNDAEPPVESGSIAIWNYRVALALREKCDVTICARARETSVRDETVDRIRYRRFSTGLDQRLLPWLQRAAGLRRRPFFASDWYFSFYTRQVAAALTGDGPDIIHFHNLSQMTKTLARRNRRAKLVLHMHCEWLGQLDRKLIGSRLDQVDLVVGCSDHITSGARSAFPDLTSRSLTVHNGVDTAHFRPADPDDPSPDAGPPEVLFVGRITPEKGLHVLIEAFREVARRHPDVRLRIVGPDAPTPYEFIASVTSDPRVAALAPHYRVDYPRHLRSTLPRDLDGRVTFEGFVPQTELPPLYRRATVLVNPSFSESFGMSLIEAMACGVPVIATRVGGMPEVVRDEETGRLIEPGDPEALAGALLDALGDVSACRRMGEAARRTAVERFSWERIGSDLLAAYGSL